MKRNEELITALRYCDAVVNDTKNTGHCNFCQYRDHCSDLDREAADTIESAYAEIEALKAKNASIRQNSVSHEAYVAVCVERNAAVTDMKLAAAEGNALGCCVICVHADVEPDDKAGPCWDCTNGHCNFKWRGTTSKEPKGG